MNNSKDNCTKYFNSIVSIHHNELPYSQYISINDLVKKIYSILKMLKDINKIKDEYTFSHNCCNGKGLVFQTEYRFPDKVVKLMNNYSSGLDSTEDGESSG